MRRIAETLGMPLPEQIVDFDQLSPSDPAAVLDVGRVDADDLTAGRFDASTGQASFDAVCRAIDAVSAGDARGIVTGPIQKEAWDLAGVGYPGHTELLARRTGTDDVRMMLTSPEISCVLVTIHVPLADVPAMLTADAIVRSIKMGHDAISRRLQRAARVTVCGLNPHAGENGLFSHGEEARVIAPAIETCRRLGIEVRGPLPPDTAFTPAGRAATDVYVCMYHDQGLIPLKALAFDEAVNVTLGLPIVRTSVDHGTALDLAWTGTASDASFQAAIRMAIDLIG